MDRVWLLTWTTYGTGLPGDDRGFVTNVRDDTGAAVRHNSPRTPYDRASRGLVEFARETLAGPPVWLRVEHAAPLAEQLRETARYRGWTILALAVMSNHVHVVVRVPGDPDPETLLRDFKSYASRRLSAVAGKPAAGTWWTAGGSKRKKADDAAVQVAVRYVKNQERPLLVWSPDEEPTGEPGASAPGFSPRVEREPGG